MTWYDTKPTSKANASRSRFGNSENCQKKGNGQGCEAEQENKSFEDAGYAFKGLTQKLNEMHSVEGKDERQNASVLRKHGLFETPLIV